MCDCKASPWHTLCGFLRHLVQERMAHAVVWIGPYVVIPSVSTRFVDTSRKRRKSEGEEETFSDDWYQSIDWTTCERHAGALVLRGNRCVLVRSAQWKGMRIPSVAPKLDESAIDAIKLCLQRNPDDRPPIVGDNGLLNQHKFLHSRRI